jgi:hypothetical protein
MFLSPSVYAAIFITLNYSRSSTTYKTTLFNQLHEAIGDSPFHALCSKFFSALALSAPIGLGFQ